MQATNGCVILVYHRFSDEEPKSTSTSSDLFNQHLEYLKQNNVPGASFEKSY